MLTQLEVSFGKGAAACTPVMTREKRKRDDFNVQVQDTIRNANAPSQHTNSGAINTSACPPSFGATDVLSLHRPYCPW